MPPTAPRRAQSIGATPPATHCVAGEVAPYLRWLPGSGGIEPAFDLFLSLAGLLLDLANQLLVVALDLVDLVVGQVAPEGAHLALELVPATRPLVARSGTHG